MKMEMWMVKVKYLLESEIEWSANKLLAEFGASFGIVSAPPVPVEEILETHLKLTMEFDDLQKLLGFRDILGALWAPERRVAIDESLDPCEHPNQEGRFHFTVGHEIGHWELHRHYFLADPTQGDMFPDLRCGPSVICRISQSKEPVEWQADNFSACLLMPRAMVASAWETAVAPRRRLTHDLSRESLFLDIVIDRLAEDFQVSKQAMQIRLDDLNLTPRAPGPLFSGQLAG
jgi:hypothetical protein